ncbi:hypothetical protein LCGC14_1060350 [marine sediment metagenome]|uniref:HTH cro/C1-type domain-containing protein n=1 Tax=marine sediment metagenome TaxID=412755 RepID=A0A0F9QS51_9ZZZZ|nr:XRE family transcriptional regulator [Candidatus Aminicenantes bacterium]HEB36031.1 XRE family transcriptional regulator [Candidatus Aminicenantes bacterium]
MNPKTLFGDFFKEKRIEKGFTLRMFCKKFSFDPGNISKMERGLMNPPGSREKLEKYALCLGIEKGSDGWFEFFDRAATCKGEIPTEILENDELMKSLPLIFRTFRSKKISKTVVADLIERIKEL